MKAFFPETCPKYPRSVMRTGDGIPAGRVADGQEHEARCPHAVGGERGEHGGEQGETRGPWAGARRPRPPFTARGQEHGGDEPAQQDSRGRPEQDGDRGHASRMRPSGTGGMRQGTPVPAPARKGNRHDRPGAGNPAHRIVRTPVVNRSWTRYAETSKANSSNSTGKTTTCTCSSPTRPRSP